MSLPTTFLEICRSAARKCGVPGSGPPSVVAQSGEQGLIVDNVREALFEIQDEQEKWSFLRNDLVIHTVPGQSWVAATAGRNASGGITAPLVQGIKDADDLTIFDSALGAVNEAPLHYEPWEVFSHNRRRGARESEEGIPQFYSRKTDGQFELWPKPDKDYTIRGVVYAKPYQATNNTDAFHPKLALTATYLAVIKYAEYDEADKMYVMAEKRVKSLKSDLMRECLPLIELGAEPLA